MTEPTISREEAFQEFINLVAYADRLQDAGVTYRVSNEASPQWGEYFSLTVNDVLYPKHIGEEGSMMKLLLYIGDLGSSFTPLGDRLRWMREFLEKIGEDAPRRILLLEKKRELLEVLSLEEKKVLGLE